MASKLLQVVTGWSGFRVLRKQVVLVGIALIAGIMAMGASAAPAGSPVHELVEWVGILLIFICVFGRTCCSLYIGGQKNVKVVAIGPYSICRNPLYVFSIIGAAGVGAQSGSVTITVVAALFAWLVFHRLVVKEERNLRGQFGSLYDNYCTRVPRYLPRFSLWSAPPTVEVQMPRVARTFFDACIFLLAVPAAEAYETLQHAGFIPILFHLV